MFVCECGFELSGYTAQSTARCPMCGAAYDTRTMKLLAHGNSSVDGDANEQASDVGLQDTSHASEGSLFKTALFNLEFKKAATELQSLYKRNPSDINKKALEFLAGLQKLETNDKLFTTFMEDCLSSDERVTFFKNFYDATMNSRVPDNFKLFVQTLSDTHPEWLSSDAYAIEDSYAHSEYTEKRADVVQSAPNISIEELEDLFYKKFESGNFSEAFGVAKVLFDADSSRENKIKVTFLDRMLSGQKPELEMISDFFIMTFQGYTRPLAIGKFLKQLDENTKGINFINIWKVNVRRVTTSHAEWFDWSKYSLEERKQLHTVFEDCPIDGKAVGYNPLADIPLKGFMNTSKQSLTDVLDSRDTLRALVARVNEFNTAVAEFESAIRTETTPLLLQLDAHGSVESYKRADLETACRVAAKSVMATEKAARAAFDKESSPDAEIVELFNDALSRKDAAITAYKDCIEKIDASFKAQIVHPVDDSAADEYVIEQEAKPAPVSIGLEAAASQTEKPAAEPDATEDDDFELEIDAEDIPEPEPEPEKTTHDWVVEYSNETISTIDEIKLVTKAFMQFAQGTKRSEMNEKYVTQFYTKRKKVLTCDKLEAPWTVDSIKTYFNTLKTRLNKEFMRPTVEANRKKSMPPEDRRVFAEATAKEQTIGALISDSMAAIKNLVATLPAAKPAGVAPSQQKAVEEIINGSKPAVHRAVDTPIDDTRPKIIEDTIEDTPIVAPDLAQKIRDAYAPAKEPAVEELIEEPVEEPAIKSFSATDEVEIPAKSDVEAEPVAPVFRNPDDIKVTQTKSAAAFDIDSIVNTYSSHKETEENKETDALDIDSILNTYSSKSAEIKKAVTDEIVVSKPAVDETSELVDTEKEDDVVDIFDTLGTKSEPIKKDDSELELETEPEDTIALFDDDSASEDSEDEDEDEDEDEEATPEDSEDDISDTEEDDEDDTAEQEELLEAKQAAVFEDKPVAEAPLKFRPAFNPLDPKTLKGESKPYKNKEGKLLGHIYSDGRLLTLAGKVMLPNGYQVPKIPVVPAANAAPKPIEAQKPAEPVKPVINNKATSFDQKPSRATTVGIPVNPIIKQELEKQARNVEEELEDDDITLFASTPKIGATNAGLGETQELKSVSPVRVDRLLDDIDEDEDDEDDDEYDDDDDLGYKKPRTFIYDPNAPKPMQHFIPNNAATQNHRQVSENLVTLPELSTDEIKGLKTEKNKQGVVVKSVYTITPAAFEQILSRFDNPSLTKELKLCFEYSGVQIYTSQDTIKFVDSNYDLTVESIYTIKRGALPLIIGGAVGIAVLAIVSVIGISMINNNVGTQSNSPTTSAPASTLATSGTAAVPSTMSPDALDLTVPGGSDGIQIPEVIDFKTMEAPVIKAYLEKRVGKQIEEVTILDDVVSTGVAVHVKANWLDGGEQDICLLSPVELNMPGMNNDYITTQLLNRGEPSEYNGTIMTPVSIQVNWMPEMWATFVSQTFNKSVNGQGLGVMTNGFEGFEGRLSNSNSAMYATSNAVITVDDNSWVQFGTDGNYTMTLVVMVKDEEEFVALVSSGLNFTLFDCLDGTLYIDHKPIK